MLKKVFVNFKLYIGILILFIFTIIIGYPYIEQLLTTGYSAEGLGWETAYIYCITNEKILLFVPVVSPMIAADNLSVELKSRFSLFCCCRIGKKRYIANSILENLLSGGFTVTFSMIFVYIFLYFRLNENVEPMVDTIPILSTLLLSLLRGFLNGALWACVGSCAAVITRNKHLAYATPFVIYYILYIFQERYYSNMSFLNPRYWAAPIYYNDFFCIAVLLLLTMSVGGLLWRVTKGRVDHG